MGAINGILMGVYAVVAVGNVSGNRCVSDCRSRGPEFNPGQVPNFPGD